MGTPILGYIGLALESLTNPGAQLLMADTAVSAFPASLSTQPNGVSGQSGYSGMRLLIIIKGNTATGTITATGKDFSQAQNPLAETTNTIPVAGTASNPTGTYYYLTSAVYSAINSSGITVSSLTNGVVRIYGIQAASKLEPAMVDIEEKFPPFSPEEQRGLTSRDTNIIQLIKEVTVGKIEQVFYPDTGLFFPFQVMGSTPNKVTMPASPTVIKSSTAVSSFPITSYTAQPNTIGPGSLIQLVVTGSSAVGTVTVLGTKALTGEVISEVVQCGLPGAANGNGTWYTYQVFASLDTVTGLTATGLTSGSVAVNGIIGEQYTWLGADSGTGASSQLATAALEWYTGTDAIAASFVYFEEATLEGATEKEMKWSGKGRGQDMISIGDRTVTPMTANTAAVTIGTSIGGFSTLWQNFDITVAGWQTNVWIDVLSGTPGTTAYNSVLDWKITFKTPQKPSYPATNRQTYSKAYRQRRETEIDLTVIFDDIIQYEKFKQNFVKQLVNIQFLSNAYMGVYNSTPTFKNWNFIFAAKIIEAKRDTSKEKVEGKFKLKCEYTPSLGYEYKCIVQNQVPPTYNL